MISSNSPVLIVGAGAIGAVTASMMARAGRRVELVCKHTQIADRALYPGFHIFGQGFDITVKVEAVARIDEISTRKDIVFLATKANEALDVAEQLPAILSPNGFVVTMQNGIIEEDIAEIVGKQRVVGCVLNWGSTMHEPGEVELTSPGSNVVGLLEDGDPNDLEEIRGFLDLVKPTRVSDNIMGELFAKLIMDSCINSMGAITGLELGKQVENRRIRSIFMAISREAVKVAQAMGLQIPPSSENKIDFVRLVKGRGIMTLFKKHRFVKAIAADYERIKSPSLQSLQRGRRTEVDFLNGYICQKGVQYNVPTPVNQTILEMIHQIENGDLRISAENIEQIPLG